ncbi:glycosyltransferase [Paenibacillus hodogayensis]|uniref:Glycosyltransferase n=1 Tax=Paenibacillus hodogayensis TaxID=279208 RepID=A0ABV5VSX2_9BACL
MNGRNGKLTLSMIVKNEGGRYLRRALEAHREWIDEAVIIDDGSTDDTTDICEQALAGIPLRLIRNPQSRFANEVVLRKQQWDETVGTDPEWILNLDGDEIMESGFGGQIGGIMEGGYDAIYFRLYDMWSETHYREDVYWKAHQMYRPFLIRYKPGLAYEWKETPQHCGRFPLTIGTFSYWCHPARVKHFGWARREDRQAKVDRYLALDPGARFGWQEQYDSILDEHPHLVEWEE